MLHLVRNAVVHGIEERRRASAPAKPPVGTITLCARQESGQIVLEVQRRRRRPRSRAAARGRGHGPGRGGHAAVDSAVRDLVFAPGLSTRAQAGAVSGRGVG